MKVREQNSENAFHDRVEVLINGGYRGFTVAGIGREWDGVKVWARNDRGLILGASGDTQEEAFSNVIDCIDQEYDELLA